jgi:ribonuclease HII
MPDYSIEERILAKNGGPIAGVDEVGRGPLAGPVLAAAVILDPNRIPEGLNDSKKLTMRAREKLFARIMEMAFIGVGQASVDEIDRLNIRRATHLAMARAVGTLSEKPVFAIIDGNDPPALSCPCDTMIGGDGRSVSIAAAWVADQYGLRHQRASRGSAEIWRHASPSKKFCTGLPDVVACESRGLNFKGLIQKVY